MASIRLWHISGIIGPIDYALRMQNALYGIEEDYGMSK